MKPLLTGIAWGLAIWFTGGAWWAWLLLAAWCGWRATRREVWRA